MRAASDRLHGVRQDEARRQLGDPPTVRPAVRAPLVDRRVREAPRRRTGCPPPRATSSRSSAEAARPVPSRPCAWSRRTRAARARRATSSCARRPSPAAVEKLGPRRADQQQAAAHVAHRSVSSKSRNGSSAQWRSSNRNAVGSLLRQRQQTKAERRVVKRSRAASGWRSPTRSRPRARARISSGRRRRTVSGASLSRIPKCSRSTSPSGQYVIASPYGRHRPVRRSDRASCDAVHAPSSRTSLVFRPRGRRPA